MALAFGAWNDALWKAVDGVGDEKLAHAAGEILRAGFVLTAGNGGSSALASHAAQAISKPDYKAGGGRAAVCLTDNVPTLTAHTNDGGWDSALVECAKPLLDACPRAAVFLVSSSGESVNIGLLACYAKETNHVVIGLTGFTGGKLKDQSTVSLHVDSNDYEIVEPAHDALIHRIQYHLRALR